MQLFDRRERHYHGIASHNEGEYTFLDRSARPAAERVRTLIESWGAQHYSDGPNLRARLEAEFESTFYEMCLSAVFAALGYDVKHHPSLEGTPRRPDFLITAPNDEAIVVEAVLATDRSREEQALRRRLGSLYDEVNKSETPNFFIHLIGAEGLTQGQPSGRRIRDFIEAKLAEVDPDSIASDVERWGPDAVPSWIYTDGAFSLEFSVWPKSPGARGRKDSPPISTYPAETRMGGATAALRRAVTRKANRYSAIGKPFIIAVNIHGFIAENRIEEMEALFGSEQIFGARGSKEMVMERARDGALVGPSGPRNTRVSAVLFSRIFPWNLGTAPWRLYHNPFAIHPLTGLDWPLPQAVPQETNMRWTEGSSPGDVLDLPHDWPGKLFEE
jgi:hypothetical protein